MPFPRRPLLLALLLILLIMPTATAQNGGVTQEPAAEEAQPDAAADQDITIPVTDDPDNGIAVAVRLSQQVNPDGADIDQAIIASAMSFADAMSSALLQDDGPLLLVGEGEDLPSAVSLELRRLDPAEVVILGGTTAVPESIEEEIQRLGFATTRLKGNTRFETAVEVARTSRGAVTALLVRAFDSAGGQSPAAWADSVSAGAFAAEAGLPILLTQGNKLTSTTLAYLDESVIRAVIIVGGESAVSEAVRQELDDAGYATSRMAGENRFQTALAATGFRRVAPGTRAILIDGTADNGWQAGFAAAQQAALTGGPVLPVAGDAIPEEIAAYISQHQPPLTTCMVPRAACEDARAIAGLPPLPPAPQPQSGGGEDGDQVNGTPPTILYNPPAGSAIGFGEVVLLTADDPGLVLTGDVAVASNCVTSPAGYLPEGSVGFSLETSPDAPTGDRPPVDGSIPVQPTPATGDGGAAGGSPSPGDTPEPVEPNEVAPATPQETECRVSATFARADGATLTDEAAFHVVDLRPEIRVASFPQRQGQRVTFADRSDGPIGDWLWDFADGSTSTLQNPTHTFAAPACYDVGLTVTSPLRHWLTGRFFTDSEVRTVAIDPADQRSARIEVEFLDAVTGDPLIDERIEMVTEDGTLVRSESTRSGDGRAVFDDIEPGRYLFRYADDPLETGFLQTVPAGHTLCPALHFGPTGDLSIQVLTEGGAPIPDAVIELLADTGPSITGTTNADGVYNGTDIGATTYTYTVRAVGRRFGRGTVTIVEDALATVTLTLLPQ